MEVSRLGGAFASSIRRRGLEDQSGVGVLLVGLDDARKQLERTNAHREQLQVVNDRLTRVIREVRDRSRGIIDQYQALIQGVIGTNAQVEVQGDGAPGEGDASSSNHDRESVSSVGN